MRKINVNPVDHVNSPENRYRPMSMTAAMYDAILEAAKNPNELHKLVLAPKYGGIMAYKDRDIRMIVSKLAVKHKIEIMTTKRLGSMTIAVIDDSED